MKSLVPLQDAEDILKSLSLFDQCISYYFRHSHKLSFCMPETMEWARVISYDCLLTSEEFKDIKTIILTSQSLKKALYKSIEEKHDLLEKYYYELDDLNEILLQINEVFDESGEVKDSASKLLKRLRREKGSLDTQIRDKLKKFINGPDNKDLLQEDFITNRNDRFVIAVKGNYFKFHKGIVQDKSSSGMTYFVEPEFIVSSNNRRKEVEIEEKNEMLRILKELSDLVRHKSRSLLNNIEIIHFLDFLFAITAISFKYGFCSPVMTQVPEIELKKAMHPMLLFLKGPEETVPLDISISKNKKIIVITGPNTGGKTVTLKTVGLLVLMVNCGLPIPAGPDSVVPKLDNIMCDIGDEQDISQDLSTFSSHITKISKFLNIANDKSLILIDEIGAGTDPKEGAALGIAVLEYLRKSGSLVIATTHYGAIKAFSHMRPGYMTAMVEFDRDTLKPLYRLIAGEVGGSNAIYIAEKIGVIPEVIESAKEHLGDKEKDLDRLISNLDAQNKELQRKLFDIDKEKKALEVFKKKENARIRDKLLVVLELEKRKIAELEEMIEKMKLMQAKRKKTKKAIDTPVEDITIKKEYDEILDRVSKIRGELEVKQQEAEEQSSVPVERPEPCPGCYIKLKDLAGIFLLHSYHPISGEGEAFMNNIRMKVKKEDITEVFSSDEMNKKDKSNFHQYYEHKSIKMEINLAGLTVEAAISKLEPVIDEAYSAGKPYLKIIHGIGEGILKEAVRDYLKSRREIKEIIKGEIAYKNGGITEVQFL